MPEGEKPKDFIVGRVLKRVCPIRLNGKDVVTTKVRGHIDDPFGVEKNGSGKPKKTTSREREMAYALLERKDVPKSLANGLRINRRIKKREARKNRPPIYAPFENPPEID